MHQLLENAIRYSLNFKGWRTEEKIVVFQSDDWGSIRMPSNEIRAKLRVDPNIIANGAYAKYDTLASKNDLEALFEVLYSVKDKNNNPAVLTANCLMTNPDFEKILECDFKEYHYEHIIDTFARYDNQKALKLWYQGIEDKLFYPQFHGREHVNFMFWLHTLRHNNKSVLEAFKYKTFGVSFKGLEFNQTNFQRAWDTSLTNNEDLINKSIIDGLKLFKNLFGYNSLTVVAPNYTWSEDQEIILKKQGVLAIQGILKQRNSIAMHKAYVYHKRYTGISKTQKKLDYQRRNVFFEPSNNSRNSSIDKALQRIGISFKMKKPAIIGTHRVNFVGVLNRKNRDENLKVFKLLLNKIVNKWPDVVFMTASELALKMNKSKND